MKKFFILFVTLFIGITPCLAEEDFAPTAKSAILIDNATGEVLYEKSADDKLPPASMTKLASMLIVMDTIEKGNLSFEDKVTISEEAANMGGSQVFLQAGEVYTVSDLLKGVAIASGNDAVVALSEKIAGSQSAFVDMMNKKMKEIGALNTNFVNAHGLDAENHYSTARDMSLIAQNLLKHEKILEYTSIYEEYLEKNDGSKSWLVNTNKLVRFYDGVDGLKTGFTETAGYCLTATAKKDNFRLISVVMGEDTSENRSSDTVKLLNYGFNTYKVNTIKKKNEVLGKIRVEKGKKDFVNVVLLNDATELLKNTENAQEYQFDIQVEKIKAPVKPGDIIGTAQIKDNEGNIIDEVDLTVDEEIKKASIVDYFIRNIKIISAGKLLIKQDT